MKSIREEVIDFISAELLVSKSELRDETSLTHDLGVAGDDGSEFLNKFCNKFNVSCTGFDSTKYFGEESSGNIFSAIFELLTKRHLRNSPSLTIGDMIVGAETGQLPIQERQA